MGKMFTSYTSGKRIITRLCMELKKIKFLKNQWLNEEMAKWTEQIFFKEWSPNG
jgi:hypothetical protein